MSSGEPDLNDKTCMITGATSGIGRAAALEIARMGASLVLVCRSRERGEETAAAIAADSGNGDVELLTADFGSLAEVRGAARAYLDGGKPLHVLLNNAGVVMQRRTETADGIETTFAVNHLAPFLLTNLLLPRLRESAPARIVTVASAAHTMAGGRLDFDDLEGMRRYGAMRNYGISKLANILFTRELARRIAGGGVTANCLHPGMVATGLGTNNGWLGTLAQTAMRPFARTPEQGARTAVYLCTSPAVEGRSGLYFADCREVEPAEAARHGADAARLWELSERMTAS